MKCSKQLESPSINIEYIFILLHYEIHIFILTLHTVDSFLENLVVAQPFRKFPALSATRRFITPFTRAHNWATWIHSTHVHFCLCHCVSKRSTMLRYVPRNSRQINVFKIRIVGLIFVFWHSPLNMDTESSPEDEFGHILLKPINWLIHI
jgi:hypothetical protein